jgi:hypothetical protein
MLQRLLVSGEGCVGHQVLPAAAQVKVVKPRCSWSCGARECLGSRVAQQQPEVGRLGMCRRGEKRAAERSCVDMHCKAGGTGWRARTTTKNRLAVAAEQQTAEASKQAKAEQRSAAQAFSGTTSIKQRRSACACPR